jgi:two-component system, OmpR family, copper resistance phosphate regulon response regulator CusR
MFLDSVFRTHPPSAFQSALKGCRLRILVIEDEPLMARALVRGLQAESFEVDLAKDGEQGLNLATSQPYKAIVLDWNLPKLDGLSVLRRLRKTGSTTPIIMLTARTGVSDRVHGLRVGADDYLVKPFAFKELLVRLHGLMRRSPIFKDKLRVDDLEIDRLQHSASRGGCAIALTPREYALLEYLLLNAHSPVTRDSVIEHVWDLGFQGDVHIVDAYVRRLREKVDQGHPRPLIHTVNGLGFVLTDSHIPAKPSECSA